MTKYVPRNGRTLEEIEYFSDTWSKLTPETIFSKLEEMKRTVWDNASRETKEILFKTRGIDLSELEKRVADYKAQQINKEPKFIYSQSA